MKNATPALELETSAGTIPFRVKDGGTEVLLVRPWRERDAWGFPKGHVEKGESFRQAARRETLEETGVRVVVDDPFPPIYGRFSGRTKRVFPFLGIPNGEDEPIPADGENFDVRWWPITDLPPLHLYQRDAMAHVKRYLRFKVDREIPDSILQMFDLAVQLSSAARAGMKTDNWIDVKKSIVGHLHPRDRKMFARRHEITAKLQTNELEQTIARMWEEATGRRIVWTNMHVDAT